MEQDSGHQQNSLGCLFVIRLGIAVGRRGSRTIFLDASTRRCYQGSTLKQTGVREQGQGAARLCKIATPQAKRSGQSTSALRYESTTSIGRKRVFASLS